MRYNLKDTTGKPINFIEGKIFKAGTILKRLGNSYIQITERPQSGTVYQYLVTYTSAITLWKDAQEILIDYKETTVHHAVIYSVMGTGGCIFKNFQYDAYISPTGEIIIPEMKMEATYTDINVFTDADFNRPFGHVSNRVSGTFFARIYTRQLINEREKQELRAEFLRVANLLKTTTETAIEKVEALKMILEIPDCFV